MAMEKTHIFAKFVKWKLQKNLDDWKCVSYVMTCPYNEHFSHGQCVVHVSTCDHLRERMGFKILCRGMFGDSLLQERSVGWSHLILLRHCIFYTDWRLFVISICVQGIPTSSCVACLAQLRYCCSDKGHSKSFDLAPFRADQCSSGCMGPRCC